MISSELLFLININKLQSVISRKFDALSAHGLGFNDFVILYILSTSSESKMRRIDLAEKTGLTASGITRLLNPLEKIGMVTRETNERDARVSYVVITPNGKKIFEEAMVSAENITKGILPPKKNKSLRMAGEFLSELGGNIL
ncbi:MarR family transcriptional regulator [Chryseobacterium arthrosphaerae]|uniref:MarR family transcriptional regulator n=1 Tax=Chryseobacterium arthrosphaerae TaxID=651561 RepID=A0A1B8ZES2_9FLAO|nr:MarR family transcriptional regulator [Chryseobacterium arthrosphaerae]AYZ10721.1 MarR family transcriptional regulator [Chryseobacterium arthrosphaerae]OCA70064.1 MarR family transcriptional regulator [Chryseobacterium arthrosphaerae]QUY56081.1 MarR family transcriptional regulator [Chryseobacterium arthrosphaerae]UEQ75957.1 MarR family transcriptional regulator [Chryseobacterium arthrosphaerae]WES97287.1 MarR family transcriptional regulator [Chryseobacterium arthrosphaerae]